MSGGSLDYVYYKVEEAAFDLKRKANTPALKAFADHLLEVSKALHDVEWYLSGDTGLEQAEESIKMALGDHFKKKAIEVLISEGKQIIEQLTKLIEK